MFTCKLSEWSQELNDVAKFYSNIRLHRIDPNNLVLETPLASLWNSDRVTKSKYMISHLR